MRKLSILLILFMIFPAGCGNLYHGLPLLGPDRLQIVDTYPADGDEDVPLEALVAVTFNKDLDEVSVNPDTFVVTKSSGEETAVKGKLVFQSKSIIIFDPEYSSAMDPLAEYSIKITSGVKDREDISLESEYSFKFRTCPPEKPDIMSTFPDRDATDVPVDSQIKVYFKNPMDTGSFVVPDTFKVTENSNLVNGVLTFDGTAQVLTFDPEGMFMEPYTDYEVTVTKGGKNKHGINLEADYVFSFTTGNMVIPKVTGFVPRIGEDGKIPYNAETIEIYFNTILDDTSVIPDTTFIFKKNGFDTGADAVNVYENIIEFNPEGSLDMDPDTLYSIRITTGVKDIYGSSLEADHEISFTTSSAPDTTSPEIVSFEPVDYFFSPSGVLIKAVFSEDVDSANLSEKFSLTADGAGEGGVIACVMSYDHESMTVTYTPYHKLEEEMLYTASIAPGVKDYSGNAMETTTSWTFRHIKTYSLPCLIPGVDIECCE